jgi:hypothetical protein
VDGSRYKPRVMRLAILIWVVFAAAVALTGCTKQTVDVPPAQNSPEQAFLGPYPMGVGVTLGSKTLTLKSVQVSDVDSPYQGTQAPEGHRWVQLAFSIEGSGTNPAPGGGYFYPQFELIADGKPVSLDEQSVGFDMEAPPGVVPQETMSFQAPSDTRSLVLRLIPSFADTQTVAFRIW